MTFLLRVDGDQWLSDARAVISDYGDPDVGGTIVGVVKGNGYGLGQHLLARQAEVLGLDTIAVGTVFEAVDPALRWDRDLAVLTPFEPADTAALPAWRRALEHYGERLVVTIASPHALWELLGLTAGRPIRVLLKGMTSTRRFGMPNEDIIALLGQEGIRSALGSGALRLAGLSLHPPIDPPNPANADPWAMFGPVPPTDAHFTGSAKAEQVARWGQAWLRTLTDLADRIDGDGLGLRESSRLWVSHLNPDELASIRAALPGVPVRPRIGTAMWLGRQKGLAPRGVVLAVHDTRGVGGVGYRQRRMPEGTKLLVVGGGTAHGVAMSAPDSVRSVKRRVTVAGTGALEAMGRSASPFTWQERRLWFAEPPHATVSLLRLPKGVTAPDVGDELACQVRFTTIRFDTVLGLD